MIPSQRRTLKTKVMAEVLAMIADTQNENAICYAQRVREADEWESATEFCGALDRLARVNIFAHSTRRLAARK
jgi:hypothetical protein